MKKKIVYIAPHLSTGGMPQYLYKQIELLNNEFEIYCIEWENVTGGVLVVQRNKIVNLLGNRLLTLGERKEELFEMIKRIEPDVVHLQEIPELFMSYAIAEKLYADGRKYSIIETSHDSSQIAKNKLHFPDKFLFVSQYQIEQYKELGIPSDVVEYPIQYFSRTKTKEEAQRELGMNPNLKHIVNVGLFTPRKNQAEIIEYARSLKNYPIQFHFIGNHADNFKYYWEPLMKNWPENCKWWNERTDVENFYQAADLFLFTSRGSDHDKETMPLVIREAISWQVPSLIYNLPVYMNYFDKFNNINYLDFKIEKNENKLNNNELLILEKLNLKTPEKFFTLNGEEDLQSYTYPNTVVDTIAKYGDGAAQYFATYITKELEIQNFEIESDSVFVDLGSNIGMTARYAKEKGAKEVICFEPDPKLIEIIKKNVPTAIVHQKAISKNRQNIKLYHWPYNDVNVGPKYDVECITLKDVLNLVGKKIDYLKIDIEGAEDGIFEELTREEYSQIDKIFLENHYPEKTDYFYSTLRSKGYDILYTLYGAGQSYLYAKYNKNNVKIENNQTTVNNKHSINSRWDNNSQMIYYSTQEDINFPIIVSLKEYKSDAVLWSAVYHTMPKNVEFWMIPVAKHVHDYAQDVNFTGVKLCIYNRDTYEQIYEEPHFVKFVNIPTISASNEIPYYNNYAEFFIEKKYSNFLDKHYTNVVDVGANIGIFSFFLLKNKMTDKIICIECDKKALLDLYRNYEFIHNVKIIPKALHHTKTQISFYHSPDNPVISSTIAPEKLENHNAGIKGDVEYKIDTVTIKEIIDDIGTIDLLKIDIEGGEYNIIENLDPNLFKYINNIFIECHFFEKNYKEQYANLLNKLSNNGYLVKEFFEGQSNNPGKSEVIYAKKIK